MIAWEVAYNGSNFRYGANPAVFINFNFGHFGFLKLNRRSSQEYEIITSWVKPYTNWYLKQTSNKCYERYFWVFKISNLIWPQRYKGHLKWLILWQDLVSFFWKIIRIFLKRMSISFENESVNTDNEITDLSYFCIFDS